MENIISLDPIEIANEIFSKEPGNECSIQLYDVGDIYMLFEILMTILMEGIEKMNYLNEIDNINDEKLIVFLVKINNWFNSFGFTIDINKNKTKKENYYCKIITRNGSYGQLFIIKNIEKNYSFLLNQNHVKKNNISEIYGLYMGQTYNLEIKFLHHIPKLIKNMVQ